MKYKQVASKNLPQRVSLLAPFVVYTLVDYWTLPMWVFAVYMTLWVIIFLTALYVNITAEKVEILK